MFKSSPDQRRDKVEAWYWGRRAKAVYAIALLAAIIGGVDNI